MLKVYMPRHQMTGVLHQFVFSEPPTDAQLDAIRDFVESSHGTHHKKTKERFWLTVVEVPVLDSSAEIEVHQTGGGNVRGAAGASLEGAIVEAKGTVENKD